MICMAGNEKGKNEHRIELVRDHTLLYNPRVGLPEHKDAQLTLNT